MIAPNVEFQLGMVPPVHKTGDDVPPLQTCPAGQSKHPRLSQIDVGEGQFVMEDLRAFLVLLLVLKDLSSTMAFAINV